MKRTFLTAFLLLYILSAYEGKAQNKSLGIEAGFHQSYLKDATYSPLNYSASGFAAGINFEKNTKSANRVFARLNVASATLKTDATSFFYADKYQINIEAGYLKNVKKLGQNLHLFLGGQYHSYMDMIFYDGIESISFLAIHGVDLSAMLTYQLSQKHQLESFISIPIFGQLIRPPHTGWDQFIVDSQNEPARVFFRGSWTSLNDFFGLNFNLKYKYNLSEKWTFTANYGFKFYQTKQLELARTVTNQLTAGINLNF